MVSLRWRDRRTALAAIGNMQRKYFGVQFHPEVRHTPNGEQFLSHFAVEICGARPEWSPRSIIEEAVARVRQQVGSQRALAAVSGGVDSTVAAALVQRAIGDQLVTIFVDTGMLRKGEAEQVASTLRERMNAELITVDGHRVLDACGVIEPEQKRRIIIEFIRLRSAGAQQQPAPGGRSIQMSSNPQPRSVTKPSASRHITTWAGCRRIWTSSWWNRFASCSRMRCVSWAKSWVCPMP
jgi:hypothetical protein